MTRTGAAPATTTDDAAGSPRRRGLRRLFRRAADPDRASRRAGVEPFPSVLVPARVWVALG